MADAFWQEDATGLAGRIRRGELRSSAVLEQTLQRIDALDPRLNAVVTRLDDRARAQLARLNPDAPFAGVPMLVKETTPVSGARISYGSHWLADFVAPASIPLVQAFEALGFLIVGISNAPEFGLTDVTEPLLFGPTRNPWNLAHSPGGSSGGAAAAVAAGLVPFAHGSDGGGSLRSPAAHCGLFTLKPSRGWPQPPLSLPGAEWLPGLVSQFGVCRSVRDAQALFDGIGSGMNTPPLPSARPDRPLRVAAIGTPLHGGSADPEVLKAWREACNFLADQGHRVEHHDWPFDGPALLDAFFTAWAALARGYVAYLETSLARPLDRAKIEPWSHGLLSMADALPPAAAKAAAVTIEKARLAYCALFDHVDLLLTPVYAELAPPIGARPQSEPFATLLGRLRHAVSYTPVQNLVGAPAASIPFGTAANGLPVGVQLAGRPGDDRLLLAVSAEIEAARPWPLFAPLAHESV